MFRSPVGIACIWGLCWCVRHQRHQRQGSSLALLLDQSMSITPKPRMIGQLGPLLMSSLLSQGMMMVDSDMLYVGGHFGTFTAPPRTMATVRLAMQAKATVKVPTRCWCANAREGCLAGWFGMPMVGAGRGDRALLLRCSVKRTCWVLGFLLIENALVITFRRNSFPGPLHKVRNKEINYTIDKQTSVFCS